MKRSGSPDCPIQFISATVGGMASKGLRAMSYQVTRKLKRATNLRIPLKPLLAIPRVSCCIFIN